MKELRRKDRAIAEDEALEILKNAAFGVLSTANNEGKPYGVPLNFCVIDKCIYFHSAIEGQKIDNIKQNRHVSFCVVGNTEILPDKFSTAYESVIASGEVEEVFDKKKQIGLEGLINKFSPGVIDKGKKYIKASKDKTRVFRIIINKMTGKARKK